MINYIWGLFLVVGVLYSIIKKDPNLTNNLISSGKNGLDIILGLLPIMCLWLGIMRLAEKSGLLDRLSQKLSKYIRVIFPEVPKGDPAVAYISSNIIMNILGLGNAATPFGIKAIKELQRLNKNKDIASRSIITFLIINTSSVTIVPTTVISLRLLNNSINASEIIPVTIITSFISTIIALLFDRIFYLLTRRTYD